MLISLLIALAAPVAVAENIHSVDVAKADRDRIVSAADAALGLEPITITKYRAQLSEGGPNDFYSNGDYWWPNPAASNGLPYVQRDGQSNPNNFSYHRECVQRLRDSVAALAAAYRISDDERYVRKAADLLRVFFIDPETRMNPSLNFAQAIPGITAGRGIGIIDTLHLAEVPMAIRAMEKSKAFPMEILAELKQWFRDYSGWMITSKNGQQEANTSNNHAVAYWLQIACFAQLTGDSQNLAECRRRYKEVFVPLQMTNNGSFPAELRRTKPYGYSIFQLDNLAMLCQVASTEQDNLWQFELPDGRGIRMAMEFLYPFLEDKSKWPLKPDIQAWEGWPVRQPCLLFGGLALKEPKYLELWRKLPADPADAEVKRNMAIIQPVLWLSSARETNVRTTTIENETLRVSYLEGNSQVSLTAKSTDHVFVQNATLSEQGGVPRVIKVRDEIFGAGEAIEVSYPGGQRDRIALFPKLPFALFRTSLHNGGREPAITQRVRVLTGTVDLGKPASGLRTFGTGGLLGADKNPGSYVWLAAVEPASRNGVVFGWVTHERGSGVIFSRMEGNQLKIEPVVEYGNLRLAPGRSEDLETLAVGYFEDARLGLESWADAVARVYDIRLKPQPTGYCTWYSQPHGGAADEKHLAELAGFSATNLAPFGFSVVQIDDKWQAGWKRSNPSSPKKDFRSHDPKGPYPNGMKATADRIRALGLVPGIWFMPFAGTVGDAFFDQHPDWFVKSPGGTPYDTPWGGASLDMTHPGAREHVRSVTSRICREWGYRYIKIDGLWTGTATRQLYVNSGYKDDDLGQATFSNPEKTAIEAYRDGLKLVRQAAGDEVFILGCNGPQNMRSYGGAFGLVDAMRVGPDNGTEWKSLLRGPTFGTRHYFLHSRIWHNDPDPVYVRASIPLKHAQLICSWVAVSGQLNLSSEWIPGLPPERLDILKRTMPSHNGVARPVDLFETDLPRLWTVHGTGRNLIGAFNWENREQQVVRDLDGLGLDPAMEYVAFDYWNDTLLPVVKGRLELAVPAESCRVLAIRPSASHPQVISTSRHVTQGMIDLVEESWDESTQTLTGVSQVVGGDPYELRVVTSASAKCIHVSAVEERAGVKAVLLNSEAGPVRVSLKSPVSRNVSWRLQF